VLIQEIAPGILVGTGLIGANVGLITTGGGTVLVDAPWIPDQARAWRAEVERRSAHGVSYLINTDYHLDHLLGNCFLPPAVVVAHEATCKHLRALDLAVLIEKAVEQNGAQVPDLAQQLAGVHLIHPTLTVGKSMTLWCPERRVDVLFLGGHRAATLGVHLPEEGVLFAGDLVVSGSHPYVGDANSRQWIESLRFVRAMDVKTIIPGHGEPGGMEIVDTIYNYMTELRGRVEACFQAGHTRRETVERVRPLGAFPIAPGDEEHARRLLRSGVERIYDEIKKEAIRNRQRLQG